LALLEAEDGVVEEVGDVGLPGFFGVGGVAVGPFVEEGAAECGFGASFGVDDPEADVSVVDEWGYCGDDGPQVGAFS
jgi:hypothetical protein